MVFGKSQIKKTKKSVAATLYPDKILIVTMNHKDDYIKYGTDQFMLLPANCSDSILGEAVIHFLRESKLEDISFEEMKILNSNLKKATKIKTEKAMMSDARYVAVDVEGDEMNFVPFKNMVTKNGQKEFYRMPTAITTIQNTEVDSLIGRNLRSAWERCVFA